MRLIERRICVYDEPEYNLISTVVFSAVLDYMAICKNRRYGKDFYIKESKKEIRDFIAETPLIDILIKDEYLNESYRNELLNLCNELDREFGKKGD